ncbi:MAG: hypothetical protein IPF58_11495 [Saprospirales bacterium]|nr:hypothetical protein [Saprospirales bacterium]
MWNIVDILTWTTFRTVLLPSEFQLLSYQQIFPCSVNNNKVYNLNPQGMFDEIASRVLPPCEPYHHVLFLYSSKEVRLHNLNAK